MNQKRPASGDIEFSDLGARAIAIYQTQALLTDRLWAYFSLYSALALLMGFTKNILEQSSKLQAGNHWLWIFVIVSYVFLALANRGALREKLQELDEFRGLAQQYTAFRLRGASRGMILAFHLVITLVVVALTTFLMFPDLLSRLRNTSSPRQVGVVELRQDGWPTTDAACVRDATRVGGVCTRSLEA